MKIRWAALGWMMVGALIASGAIYGNAIVSARLPGRVICASNPCRISMTRNGQPGLVIKDARGPSNENPFLIVDPNGLAEFWQNTDGAYEGPKGEICTTDRRLSPVACLDSNGKAGWVSIGGQVLTAADIKWLHQAERAAVTDSPAARLARLAADSVVACGRGSRG